MIPGVIQPLALRTYSPSLPRHLYHHHSLAHTFFFSSQYMTIPLHTTFMHFLDISPTFAIPVIFSFLILSNLVTQIIHLNTIISATYCDLFTAYVHWFLPEFTYASSYPVLSLHTYLAVHSTYCACRFLDEALYRAPSAIPAPSIKPNCASLSLFSIILSKIVKVYQRHPSAVPTIVDVSLLFINWYNQTISPLR